MTTDDDVDQAWFEACRDREGPPQTNSYFARIKLSPLSQSDVLAGFEVWTNKGIDTAQRIRLWDMVERVNVAALHHEHNSAQRILWALLPHERLFVLQRISWPTYIALANDSLLRDYFSKALVAHLMDRTRSALLARIYNHHHRTNPSSSSSSSSSLDAHLHALSGSFGRDHNFVAAVVLRRLQDQLSPATWCALIDLQHQCITQGYILAFGPTLMHRICTNRHAVDCVDMVDLYLVEISPTPPLRTVVRLTVPAVRMRTSGVTLYIETATTTTCILVVHKLLFASAAELMAELELDLVCIWQPKGDGSGGVGEACAIYADPFYTVYARPREQQHMVALKSRGGGVSRGGAYLDQPNGECRLLLTRGSGVDELKLLARASRQLSKCYHCRTHYRVFEGDAIDRYSEMCAPCGSLNYQRLHQELVWWRPSIDNNNNNSHPSQVPHIALVTGGRIKIGYQVCLRLLRSGARVFATTRFPYNALYRYQQEPDFAAFAERLTLLGLDLRDMAGVQRLIDTLKTRLPYLSILVNNAAQTFTYDDEYYRIMHEYERNSRDGGGEASTTTTRRSPGDKMTLATKETLMTEIELDALRFVDHTNKIAPWSFSTDQFGELVTRLGGGQFWLQRAHEVTPQQLVETTIVNQLVPSMLISQCKSLMERAPSEARPRRYIISVTCREGTFDMPNKSMFHFQTNMCKSACNMITRTISEDYKQAGIYVSSVDPGYVSAAGDTNRHCPLQPEDAACRVLYPILLGEAAHTSDQVPRGKLWRHFEPLDSW